MVIVNQAEGTIPISFMESREVCSKEGFRTLMSKDLSQVQSHTSLSKWWNYVPAVVTLFFYNVNKGATLLPKVSGGLNELSPGLWL